MKQDYFIVVVAHSLHGRLKRIHVPQQLIYAILLLAVLGCFSVFGFVSSYARMVWKVSEYNALRQEKDALRVRYRNLQSAMNQTQEQLATLQLFANEVSVAYGLKQKLEGPDSIAAEGRLVPSISQSFQDFQTLRTATFPRFDRNYARRWHLNVMPSLWPVQGQLMSRFGTRIDPFSGEGAIHRGVDISAPRGTPVRATADGIVKFASWFGGYGRLVIVDHGRGVETYYAHLSAFHVLPGQEIRRGEAVGAVGTSGRVTAPHLHYEVRNGGAPVNPYRFLAKAAPVQQAERKDFPF